MWAISEKATILSIFEFAQNFIFQRAKMTVHSSLKASDTYDSLYYLAEFVVVSWHLGFDATRLCSFPSPLYPHTSRTTQRTPSQPHTRFGIYKLESTQLDASYTLV